MRKKRWTRWIGMMLALGVLIGAGWWWFHPRPPAGGSPARVVIGLLGRPNSLNPLFAAGDAAQEVLGALFRAPVQWDDHWTLRPIVAVPLTNGDVQVLRFLPDGKAESTLVLGDQVKWSDGADVTASDYRLAFQTSRTKALPIGPEAKSILDQVYRVSVSGNASLIVLWSKGLGNLSHFYPLPAHLLEDLILGGPSRLLTAPYNNNPVSNGPYQVAQVQPYWLITAPNLHYKLFPPKIPQAAFVYYEDAQKLLRDLASGALDATPSLPRAQAEAVAAKNSNLQVYYTQSGRLRAILFNLSARRWQAVKMRQAMIAGLNRLEILQAATGGRGQVAQSWLPTTHPDFATVIQGDVPNPPFARQLLQAAGCVIRGSTVQQNGQIVEVILWYPKGDEEAATIAKICESSWQQLGMVVKPEPQDPDFFLQAVQKRSFPDLAISTLVIKPWQRPMELWGRQEIPQVGNNWIGGNICGWVNAENEALCRAYDHTLVPAERHDLLYKQQQVWAGQVPVIPLFFALDVSVARKTLTNWRPRGYGEVTWNIEQWAWQQ